VLRGFRGDEADLRVKPATGLTPGISARAILGSWGENPELLAALPPPPAPVPSSDPYSVYPARQRGIGTRRWIEMVGVLHRLGFG
jgi:hypothetical protein